jgi:hypothetical protein
LAKEADFQEALAQLFRELHIEWLAMAPRRQIITDERVLRELSLPADAQTRLCYFAIPATLLSFYREIVFPIADDAGLVSASGDETAPGEGNTRALLDALLHRAHVVIGDVSSDDSRVWTELRAASLRPRPPLLGIVREEDQEIETSLPVSRVVTRPKLPLAELSDADIDPGTFAWLDELTSWLEQATHGASLRLEDEALRLLEKRMYRAAVIAAASAVEVALRERLEAEAPSLLRDEFSLPSKRATTPLTKLVDAALHSGVIGPDHREELRELQRVRNLLVHTSETIHGQRARSLVHRATRLIERVRRPYYG